MAKDFLSRVYFIDAPFTRSSNHLCDDLQLQNKLVSIEGGYLVAFCDKYSYIRKSDSLRVDLPIERVMNANYIIFRNPAHEGMNTLAFIDDFTYVNDSVTDVSFTVDYFSTFHHLISYGKCFINREHVLDDSLGLHTYPEGLETGIMINHRANRTNPSYKNNKALVPSTPCFIIALSDYYYKSGTLQRVNVIEGLPNGFGIYVFPYANLKNAYYMLDDMKNSGTIGAVSAFYMANQYMVFMTEESKSKDFKIAAPEPSWGDMSEHNETFNVLNCVENYDRFRYFTPSFKADFSNIDGYIPKNNKLFTYPYNYLEVHNNSGSMIRYRHSETYGYGQYSFIASAQNFNLNPIIKLSLANARGGEDKDKAITLGDFIQLPYPTDSYAIWALNNQGSIKARNFQQSTNQARGVMGVAKSAFSSGNPISGLLTAITGGVDLYIDHQNFVQQTLAMHEDQQAKRSQMAGTLGGSSVNFMRAAHTFTAAQKCITAEYARILDDYFTQYGYAVNRVGVPEINSRPYFNYVKTSDAIIHGKLPHKGKEQIADRLNAGVTIWHELERMYDYSVENPPQEGRSVYYDK